MANRKTKKTISKQSRVCKTGPGCRMHRAPITTLGEFFNICSGVLKKDTEFWFRGHADLGWPLIPSALRYSDPAERNRALELLADFKRYAKIKLSNLPSRDEELEWVQLARHYGLPTRLLDWTRNAAIALYFACLKTSQRDTDGAALILNPKDLNREATKEYRIFDAHTDAQRIDMYFSTPGKRTQQSCRTIAINPVWNSERIMLQQGAFTLHGPKDFTLTSAQVPSLVCLRIPATRKQQLLVELERAGINEMSIFPEPEHMCRSLVWREKLDVLGAC